MPQPRGGSQTTACHADAGTAIGSPPLPARDGVPAIRLNPGPPCTYGIWENDAATDIVARGP